MDLKSTPIEEILPYIAVINSIHTSQEKFSRLESLVKPRKTTVKEKTAIESLEATLLTSNKTIDVLAAVSYKLFIPAKEGIDIRYRVNEQREFLETKKGSHYVAIEKPSGGKEKYCIAFTYDQEKKGYSIEYETLEYKDRIEKARQDFTFHLDKFLDILPKSIMGGVLGFTYLGSGKMTRRADLFGDMALLVDVHEAIHTPDEYETRVLTDWILRMETPKYKK